MASCLRVLLGAARHRPKTVVVILLLAGLSVFSIPHLWAAYHFRRAVEAAADYQFETAQTHLAVCLERWPRGRQTRLLAAQVARRNGELARAGEHLRLCQTLGCSAKAITWESLLLRGQLGHAEALAELENRLTDSAAAPLILEVLIQDCVTKFRLLRALEYLDRFLEYRPDNVKALLGRAWVRERQFEWGAAVANYRQALRLEPDNEDIRSRLADALLVTGPPDEALAEHQWLLRRRPDSVPARLGLARCYRQLGRLPEARPLLDKLLQEQPANAACLVERGKLALTEGRPAEAEPFLRQAVRRAPHDREATYHLYVCLQGLGRPDESEQFLERFQKIDVDLKRLDDLTRQVTRRPNDAELRYQVAMIFLNREETSEGVRWLQTALGEEPGHRGAHRALADHYLRIGAVDRAAYHRRFLSLAP